MASKHLWIYETSPRCVTWLWSREPFTEQKMRSWKLLKCFSLAIIVNIVNLNQWLRTLCFQITPPPLFFVSSCANLCYLVHWPAVCQLNMALNKMSLRTWGTSVFWWMRTQQHNLLPAIPVSISPFQIQDRGGGGSVCLCGWECEWDRRGCVCVWGGRGGLLLLLLPLLCYHIMLCYWPLVFSQLDTVPSNLR